MTRKQPNVLLITVDQMRYPCLRYEQGGTHRQINEILAFQPIETANPFQEFFPGFLRLRKNAVVFDQHIIAASACVPSRATIYTGQYGTHTRVLETDSLYKYGSDPNFPWLHPRGIPTSGDWFRAAGYTTHYFGKWDLSYVDFDNPYVRGDLNQWGFADWRLCPPDAQGGSLNELGVYRDPGYADLVSNFLARQAMNYEYTPNDPPPFFCVASFVNPHDIASAYPLNWWVPEGLTGARGTPVAGVQTATDTTPWVRPIPSRGDVSNPLPGGRIGVPLNPLGFPQNTYTNPVTLNEDLSTKPDCQFDYAYKMGLALKSRRPPNQWPLQTLPFQLQKHPDAWFKAYGDFYTYLHSLVDAQIDKVLRTLDESGLAKDTIVVFLGDHGEYGGAHGGMIEKWHTAYEEILHVPFVVSSPLVNGCDEMKHVHQLTSHIDVLPTLLGLAGYDETKREQLGKAIPDQTYEPLPGANLAPVIHDPSLPVKTANGHDRRGVLFMTDDTITQYLAGEQAPPAYEVFRTEVDNLRNAGLNLAPDSVREPCHIRCARTSEWKLVKYWDPTRHHPNQWELYYLVEDLYEQYNLVSWKAGEPVPEPGRIPPGWKLTANELDESLKRMRALLVELEETYLGGPKPKTEPYTFDG